MDVSKNGVNRGQRRHGLASGEALSQNEHPAGSEIDLSLLEHSLTMTPWERMQANDDALNFGESLRAAMEKRNAES